MRKSRVGKLQTLHLVCIYAKNYSNFLVATRLLAKNQDHPQFLQKEITKPRRRLFCGDKQRESKIKIDPIWRWKVHLKIKPTFWESENPNEICGSYE